MVKGYPEWVFPLMGKPFISINLLFMEEKKYFPKIKII